MWLIDDYNPPHKVGLLYDFMTLIKHSDECWGLFDGQNNCIGFSYITTTDDIVEIELFSVHPGYRSQGLGKRFALTLIKNKDKVVLTPLTESIPFWEKLGFLHDKYHLRRMIHCINVKYTPINIIGTEEGFSGAI